MRNVLGLALCVLLSCCSTAPVTAGGRVALSFDDGPDRVLTPLLLDMLHEQGVKATFCLVGQRVRDNPAIVARIYAEGHELCNHSWNHPMLTRRNVASQIARTDEAIAAAIGRSGYKTPILRAPGGYTHAVGNCYDGRPFVGWGKWTGRGFDDGEDTNDWKYRSVSHTTSVAAQARSGAIVLMHDIHASTVRAVPGILKRLSERGVSLVTVSDVWQSSCGGSQQAAR